MLRAALELSRYFTDFCAKWFKRRVSRFKVIFNARFRFPVGVFLLWQQSSIVAVLTVNRTVVPVRVDPLVRQDLDVFPTGSAVQLVGSSQTAAHSVREPALLGDMVLEIRRGLRGVLQNNGKQKHVNWARAACIFTRVSLEMLSRTLGDDKIVFFCFTTDDLSPLLDFSFSPLVAAALRPHVF